jgi:hypothetical protein
MKKIIVASLLILTSTIFAKEKLISTELLDEAQTSLKEAYENGCKDFAPYEYYKAVVFYDIAKLESSKLNVDLGKAAALESIKWSLKAISKRYSLEVKNDK